MREFNEFTNLIIFCSDTIILQNVTKSYRKCFRFLLDFLDLLYSVPKMPLAFLVEYSIKLNLYLWSVGLARAIEQKEKKR